MCVFALTKPRQMVNRRVWRVVGWGAERVRRERLEMVGVSDGANNIQRGDPASHARPGATRRPGGLFWSWIIVQPVHADVNLQKANVRGLSLSLPSTYRGASHS
jgi:hypothetical protein